MGYGKLRDDCIVDQNHYFLKFPSARNKNICNSQKTRKRPSTLQFVTKNRTRPAPYNLVVPNPVEETSKMGGFDTRNTYYKQTIKTA